MPKLCFFLFLLFATAFSAQAQEQMGYELSYEEALNGHPHQILVSTLLENAFKHEGTPYRYGGVSPKGFDCSGFMYYIFKAIQVDLPHSSKMIANIGFEISREEVRAGDLIFFKGSNKNSTQVGHVGLVSAVEEGHIYFIHASSSNGVRVDELDNNRYFAPRFLSFRRWEW
ncbi:MAG: C40 family peptidase [Luteibaculum sp.]